MSWHEDPEAVHEDVMVPIFQDRLLEQTITSGEEDGEYSLEYTICPRVFSDRKRLYNDRLNASTRDQLNQTITVERTHPFSDDRSRLQVHSIQPLLDESDDLHEQTVGLSGFPPSMREHLTGLNGITRLTRTDEDRRIPDDVIETVLGPPSDVQSAVNEYSKYFDSVVKPLQEKLDCSTRQNGSVGAERYGQADYETAQTIRENLYNELGNHRVSVSITTIDEWVHLDVDYSPALDEAEASLTTNDTPRTGSGLSP